MTMNDVGQVVYRYAEEIFSLGRELQDALEDRLLERPIRVQIGIADVLSKMVVARLLSPILGSLHTYKLICREGQPDHLVSQLILHDLDIVLTDKPIGPNLRVKGFNHLLGESVVAMYAASSIADRYKSGFPESLDGAPFILPGDRTELRGSLEHWFKSRGIRPKVVAECDDSALVKSLGKAKAGLFVAPRITKTEILKQYNVREVGCLEGIVEKYYAVSMDRRIKHPAVQVIVEYAKNSVFAV